MIFVVNSRFNVQTRGHVYKLYKPRGTGSVKYNFFSQRAVSMWDVLHLSVKFSSLNAFRLSIYRMSICRILLYVYLCLVFETAVNVNVNCLAVPAH